MTAALDILAPAPAPVAPTEREKWLAERRKGIGSSDIAAIIGANPYAGPLDVWLDKTGRQRDDIETRVMRLGRSLEPVILAEFVLETGKEAALDGKHYTSERNPIFKATPDGLVTLEENGVELKAPGLRQSAEWGPSWSEHYPEHYLAQCVWQMGVTGRPGWYLGALLGGQDFRVYRIHRDEALIEGLFEAAERFWRDYVVADRAPAFDSSESTRRYLESVYPTNAKPLRDATDEEEALARELAQARADKADAIERAETIGNQLRNSIGEAEGIRLLGKSGKVTWKTQKGSTRVDYEAALRELAGPAGDVTALIAKHTHTGEPKRVFRVAGPLFKHED